MNCSRSSKRVIAICGFLTYDKYDFNSQGRPKVTEQRMLRLRVGYKKCIFSHTRGTTLKCPTVTLRRPYWWKKIEFFETIFFSSFSSSYAFLRHRGQENDVQGWSQWIGHPVQRTSEVKIPPRKTVSNCFSINIIIASTMCLWSCSYVAYYASLALRCTIIYVNVNMLRIDDELFRFPRNKNEKKREKKRKQKKRKKKCDGNWNRLRAR